MMERNSGLILAAFLVAGSFNAAAQDIVIEGKVRSSFGNKGVKASINYKSYPTGGITGRFNDSTFTFPIFGSSKYQITAEADGYIPRTIIVDPKEAVNGKINRDIILAITGETIRLSHLIFNQGKASMKQDSYSELDELVAMMKSSPKIEIQLEGHTDNQGNADANLKLSEDRVEAVKKYMVSKGSIKIESTQKPLVALSHLQTKTRKKREP
jgi:Outer membrane protein and related peptidoglycan-associated (lipo)proteins